MMVIEQRLAEAVKAKDDGSAALREGHVKRASFLYKSVYMHLGDLVSPVLLGKSADGEGGGGDGILTALGSSRKTKLDAAMQKRIDDVFAASLNNLALTHLKLGRPGGAVDCATRVLAYTPDNAKARYRRARGRIVLGLLEEAKGDLVEVLRRLPDDPEAMAALQELTVLELASAAKEKKMFQRMFASSDA